MSPGDAAGSASEATASGGGWMSSLWPKTSREMAFGVVGAIGCGLALYKVFYPQHHPPHRRNGAELRPRPRVSKPMTLISHSSNATKSTITPVGTPNGSINRPNPTTTTTRSPSKVGYPSRRNTSSESQADAKQNTLPKRETHLSDAGPMLAAVTNDEIEARLTQRKEQIVSKKYENEVRLEEQESEGASGSFKLKRSSSNKNKAVIRQQTPDHTEEDDKSVPISGGSFREDRLLARESQLQENVKVSPDPPANQVRHERSFRRASTRFSTGGSWRAASVSLGVSGRSSIRDTTFRNANTLYGACRKGQYETAKTFLKRGMDPNTPGNQVRGAKAIHIAAQQNRIEFIRLLLNFKADPNALTDEKISPIFCAAVNGHIEAINLLVKGGANVNHMPESNYKTSPLYAAYKAKKLAVFSALINHGADANLDVGDSYTLLSQALDDNMLDYVEILIEGKADVDMSVGTGVTPLMVAVLNGNVDAVDILIKGGADVNKLDSAGLHPLFLAVQDPTEEQQAIGIMLLQSGSEFNLRDSEGKTPLYIAAEVNNAVMVNELIRYNADCNAALGANGSAGITPLMIATQEEHATVVTALLNANADVTCKASQSNVLFPPGSTALSIARAKGNSKITRQLTAASKSS